MPRFDANAINLMFGPALAIAFLAALENNVMAKTMASRSGDNINNNQEMLSVGVANLFCSFLSGQPASGSLTRSALNYSSGAATQFASLFCGALCFIAAISIGPFVAYVPRSVLAVLVISIALSLFNKRNINIALKTTKSDATVLVVTFVTSLITTLDVAIFTGVATSIVLYLRKASRPQMAEYEFDESGALAEKEEKKARQIPEISIVHVEGDLFFGASEVFREQIQRIAAEPNLKVIVLRLRNARHLDATSVMALEDLYNFMSRKECALIISGVRRDVLRVLKNSGLIDIIGRENIFMGSPTNPNLSTRNALIRAQEVLGTKEAEIRIFYNPKKEEQSDERRSSKSAEKKEKKPEPEPKPQPSTMSEEEAKKAKTTADMAKVAEQKGTSLAPGGKKAQQEKPDPAKREKELRQTPKRETEIGDDEETNVPKPDK
jgi:SulP family sulfate permease